MAQRIERIRLEPREIIKETLGVPIHSVQPAAVMAQHIEPTLLAQPETIRATLGAQTLSVPRGVAMAQRAVLTLLEPCAVTKRVTQHSTKDAVKRRCFVCAVHADKELLR